jgi:hypothetical protein
LLKAHGGGFSGMPSQNFQVSGQRATLNTQ